MPVYLLHGFRWPRDGLTGIKIHTILHNLEDVAPEYLQPEQAQLPLLRSFEQKFPDIMQHLQEPKLRFIEQYDPDDEETSSQPYAYVADRVITMAAGKRALLSDPSIPLPPTSSRFRSRERPHTASTSDSGRRSASVDLSSSSISSILNSDSSVLSLSIDETMKCAQVTPAAWQAFAELRDQIAGKAHIGWYVVYNGDPDRNFEAEDIQDEESFSGEDEAEGLRTPTQYHPGAISQLLGKPLPTMLPPGFQPVPPSPANQIVKPIFVPSAHSAPSRPSEDDQAPSKTARSFSLPLRKKLSRVKLPVPTTDDIPDPPKLKEINKREGLRKKFFSTSRKADS